VTFRSRWAPDLFAWVALACLAGLSIHRAQLVEDVYGVYTGCAGCFNASVWANDALLAAGFVALIGVSRATNNRYARWVIALVAVAGVIAYFADLVVFRLLTHRLRVSDVIHFAPDTFALVEVARPLLATPEWRLPNAEALIATLCAVAGITIGAAHARRAAAWFFLAAILAGVGYAIPQASYVHQVGIKNLWQVNAEIDPTREYTAAFSERISAMPALASRCEPGVEDRVSVVLAIVESLSAYHSKLLSGLHDYTPNLDRLAARGTYFTHFFANGYSTEGGEISLLTGHVPLHTAGSRGSVMAFTDVEGDFHRWLAKEGYETAFFTSASLSYGELGRWHHAIGIEEVDGAESPFYDGMPRGPFGAAEDAALIDRFLQWHDQRQQKDKPFMATLLTVESHPPFPVARLGRNDEAASLRHVDTQLARLVDALDSRGFFRKGVLIIVGDHRAMTPIPAEEFERLGASAPARIFAMALGRTGLHPGEEPRNLQQTDLIPSLRHLIDRQSCRNDWQGRFLGGEAQPARFVVRADSLNRNQVVVTEDARQYRLLLDGDQTRWISPPTDADDGQRLLLEVNRERVARQVGP